MSRFACFGSKSLKFTNNEQRAVIIRKHSGGKVCWNIYFYFDRLVLDRGNRCLNRGWMGVAHDWDISHPIWRLERGWAQWSQWRWRLSGVWNSDYEKMERHQMQFNAEVYLWEKCCVLIDNCEIFFPLNQNKNTRRLCQCRQQREVHTCNSNFMYWMCPTHLRDDMLLISSICKAIFISNLMW